LTQVLILRDDLGHYHVAEEYNTDDYGRLHLLGLNKYAYYHKDEAVIEYAKVCIPVVEVVYIADTWPIDLPARTPEAILEYFGFS